MALGDLAQLLRTANGNLFGKTKNPYALNRVSTETGGKKEKKKIQKKKEQCIGFSNKSKSNLNQIKKKWKSILENVDMKFDLVTAEKKFFSPQKNCFFENFID